MFHFKYLLDNYMNVLVTFESKHNVEVANRLRAYIEYIVVYIKSKINIWQC